MTDDTELLKKRFIELANKSYNSGIFVFTDFLGLMEQSAFSEIKKEIRGIPYTSFGGAKGAERVMIRFGSEEELGYELPFPISVIKAEPVSQKFADKLTHRDFLGAILNLGIERSTLGDIAIIDNVGYIFASEDIADYIVSSLTKVKHTDMRLKIVDELPDGELYRTEIRRVQANGERVDAIIAKVFGLSREDSSALFKKRLVFIDGKCTENTSYIPKEGEVISVRGHGRMIYRGCDSLTRKGKMNIVVEVYV
jgi:RNA-binding protein YlmH